MKGFIKIELAKKHYKENVGGNMYLAIDKIVAVYVQNDVTCISTIDGHVEKTDECIDKLIERMENVNIARRL